MKTYTFKVKLHYASEKRPFILSVTHCPLEVLFDSLKQVKQFKDVFEAVKNPSNKEVPGMYITASDYVNTNGEYVHNDYILCEYNAILESNSLKELLAHKDYYGFIDGDISTAKTEQELVIESFELNESVKEKLEKEVVEDEV